MLLDKAVDEANNVWLGRSFGDAPDVDSTVFVTGEKGEPLSSGSMIDCEIVSFKDYDLIGAAVGASRT